MEREDNNNKEMQQPPVHLVRGSHADSQDSPNLGKGPKREEDTIMEMDEKYLAHIDLDR
jgi:hypothetical protein